MKKNNRLLPDWKDSGGLQQVSRMMKCVLFFMLTLVCGVQGKVYSQQYTLDLHLKQTSLEEVFNRIEAQTGLKFLVQYPAHRLKRESGCRSPAGRHPQSAG